MNHSTTLGNTSDPAGLAAHGKLNGDLLFDSIGGHNTLGRRLAAEYPNEDPGRGIRVLASKEIWIHPQLDGPIKATASIALAIVLDDSLSMLAQGHGGGKTRWERAQKAAQDLVSDAREGDAVAIVLAGAPPRIALASTTDLRALSGVVESLTPSHRATDLEGALELAGSLVHGLPQVDHRIVLLSDLADGKPDAPPLGESSDIPIWAGGLLVVVRPRSSARKSASAAGRAIARVSRSCQTARLPAGAGTPLGVRG
jgi:hypothetical protein